MTLAPTKPSPSLYTLALESQEIDGELAIALAKLESEDPEQLAEAETLIEGLLARANDTQRNLARKANAICQVREALLGKAAYLRNAAAERLAKAEAEERNAQRLADYLLKTLQTLHPGQTKFDLPEFTIASRASEAVEVDLDETLPAEFTRVELKLKLTGAGSVSAEALRELVRSHIEEALDLPAGTYQLGELNVAPDKTAIKDAIKEGASIPGAQLVKRRSWSIK